MTNDENADDASLLSHALTSEATAVLGPAAVDVLAALRADSSRSALATLAFRFTPSSSSSDARSADDATRRYRNCVWALRVLLERVLSPTASATGPVGLASRACCVARLVEAQLLAQQFTVWCRQSRVRAPRGAVTRWLLTTRLLEPAHAGDWLLPSSAARDGGLEHELLRAGASPDAVLRLGASLAQASRRAAERVLRLAAADGAAPNAPSSLGASARDFVAYAEQVSVERRADLQRRFVGAEPFERMLFCVLSTYAALGCEPRGGEGYHAAVTAPTFAALRAELGVTAECFASPLNCTLPQYSSAFGDTFERSFGSSGSFFAAASVARLIADGGAFEANPPFLEEHMLAMALTMELCLQRCRAPLTFAVFVPQWRDSPYFELLHRSRFTRFERDAVKGEHEYTRGLGHLPQSGAPKLVAYADTTVFFVQNDAAWTERPITDAQVEAVMNSMKKR
jgi:hypothetical protein